MSLKLDFCAWFMYLREYIFKVGIENKTQGTLTPPGGYLYPFHIVPAMRSIHKTTIIAGLLSWWCVQSETGGSEGVVFYSEPWKLGCLHARPDGGWPSMVAPGWGASWSSSTWSGSPWLSGGQSSDTNCDINSCDLEDQAEWEGMGQRARVSGV